MHGWILSRHPYPAAARCAVPANAAQHWQCAGLSETIQHFAHRLRVIAMRAKHWLVGLTLCIAGIGAASATHVDAQDADTVTRTSADSATSNAHDNSPSGGDALGLTGSTTQHTAPGESSSSSSSSSHGGDRSGGDNAGQQPTRQPHLGWQSLLPGSIQ